MTGLSGARSEFSFRAFSHMGTPAFGARPGATAGRIPGLALSYKPGAADGCGSRLHSGLPPGQGAALVIIPGYDTVRQPERAAPRAER